MKIELKNSIINDKYTEYVYEKFDIQNRNETITEVSFNLGEAKTFDWNIGVILGGSGSGKTTILKQLGDIKSHLFDENKPLISNFDFLEPHEATLALSSMGLSSVPTWLRPFKNLSNGEQYRAKLAYLVSNAKDNECILIDEYTSVVDRDVAKAMSFALQKYIRKTNKKIVLASCHFDILEWLMPDWTCSPQKGGVLERGDYLRQGRPQISLQVSRVEPDTWNFFKKHHYMTDDVNESCKFFLFEWNNKPIAINCVIPQPSGYFQNGVRESRIVVLPDYQGLSLGSKISEFTASIYKNSEYRYFTKTVHPALGKYREDSKSWKATSKNLLDPNKLGKNKQFSTWDVRNVVAYCHEYIGESLSGYEELLLPIDQMRYNNSMKYQLSLF